MQEKKKMPKKYVLNTFLQFFLVFCNHHLLQNKTEALYSSLKQQQQPEKVFFITTTENGTKLKNLIDCFAWYLPEASLRHDNSKINGCSFSQIQYCKTDSGNNDHFCHFDGTNHLQDWYQEPNCYFNCQMETCNAWDVAHDDRQEKCIEQLHNDNS